MGSVTERPPFRKRRFNYGRIALVMSIVTLATTSGWFFTATPVLDLGVSSNMLKSGLYQRWAQGEVVVMVRHAERCDRSGNTCLGSADGITKIGSNAAVAVGFGLQRLGLENTRMLASPLTRTRQTADFIAGRAVPTQNWLSECDNGFKGAVMANKNLKENLVLITHSGCIDQFERKMGVHASDRSSEYTQAFFVQVDGTHAPKILGSLDAAQWKNLTIEQSN
ncbi:Ais protein [Pseudomonas syringae]|uniref:Ais protein n=1 Tax=Pseudomonas syringae TaxID=317 RepID=A0A085VDF8_PSESX|nr:Ais protein [Pseudomonas syringae]